MTDHNHDPDPDRDPDPANDNGGGSRSRSDRRRARSTLTALGTTLNTVDTASIVGRSGLPLLTFKSRDSGGIWTFGQKHTIVEDGSRWAVNPRTFQWGYICFGDDNKVLGEKLVPVSQPMPDVTELPDKGFPWQRAVGGQPEVHHRRRRRHGGDLQDQHRRRHPGHRRTDRRRSATASTAASTTARSSPIVLLEKDSYPHPQYGKIWTPLLTIIDWMPLDGPAPAPAPPPPPPPSAAEQPRRRRVA